MATSCMENSMDRILLIEDDMDLQQGLSFTLTMEGYQIDTAETKKTGKQLFAQKQYDLIIVDCNLPDGNGFEICTEIRKHSMIPILMLTARNAEIDEVQAFHSGANDYMSKPFSLSVLKARIHNLLRKPLLPDAIKIKEITLDKNTCKVYKNGEEISVSSAEYRLLLYLMENQGQILSKEQILTHIWDYNGKFVDRNIVSVNIRRLRMKIETDSTNPEYIKTVHGLGYIFSP